MHPLLCTTLFSLIFLFIFHKTSSLIPPMALDVQCFLKALIMDSENILPQESRIPSGDILYWTNCVVRIKLDTISNARYALSAFRNLSKSIPTTVGSVKGYHPKKSSLLIISGSSQLQLLHSNTPFPKKSESISKAVLWLAP